MFNESFIKMTILAFYLISTASCFCPPLEFSPYEFRWAALTYLLLCMSFHYDAQLQAVKCKHELHVPAAAGVLSCTLPSRACSCLFLLTASFTFQQNLPWVVYLKASDYSIEFYTRFKRQNVPHVFCLERSGRARLFLKSNKMCSDSLGRVLATQTWQVVHGTCLADQTFGGRGRGNQNFKASFANR